MTIIKKLCITFFAITIIILSVGCTYTYPQKNTDEKEEYLRIHIRANSNGETDQTVKYKVKDSVVEYLTPFIAECDTKEKAIEMLNGKMDEIEEIANGVLSENGFDYKSSGRVKKEKFPTRVYGNLTLSEGIYDALILELGSGKGDNWWCVVYPPLCFTAEKEYKYKSKIYEIIKKFLENRG